MLLKIDYGISALLNFRNSWSRAQSNETHIHSSLLHKDLELKRLKYRNPILGCIIERQPKAGSGHLSPALVCHPPPTPGRARPLAIAMKTTISDASSYRSRLLLQRRNEFFSLQPSLLNDRDQSTFRQLRVIGHCHNQIPLFIPEVDMAAGLAIDLKVQVLQSLDGFLSRDYWELEQIVRPLCQEMRAFAP